MKLTASANVPEPSVELSGSITGPNEVDQPEQGSVLAVNGRVKVCQDIRSYLGDGS